MGFSEKDRAENIRRVGHVAKLFADSGCVSIASFISPYKADRELARKFHEDSGLKFYEVYVNASFEVCETRDPKGLYKKARAGEIKGFTGLDDPYEAPENPELILDTAANSLEDSTRIVLEFLEKEGIIQKLE